MTFLSPAIAGHTWVSIVNRYRIIYRCDRNRQTRPLGLQAFIDLLQARHIHDDLTGVMWLGASQILHVMDGPQSAIDRMARDFGAYSAVDNAFMVDRRATSTPLTTDGPSLTILHEGEDEVLDRMVGQYTSADQEPASDANFDPLVERMVALIHRPQPTPPAAGPGRAVG